jgi:hypothetical protein
MQHRAGVADTGATVVFVVRLSTISIDNELGNVRTCLADSHHAAPTKLVPTAREQEQVMQTNRLKSRLMMLKKWRQMPAQGRCQMIIVIAKNLQDPRPCQMVSMTIKEFYKTQGLAEWSP